MKRLLYIEDETAIAELYGRSLQKAGYQVTLAADGRQGLMLAESQEFDIILLDLMLPGFTGADILNELNRTLTGRRRPRIIITTNLEERKSIRDRLMQQVDGYLIKADTTPSQLVSYLSRLKDSDEPVIQPPN